MCTATFVRNKSNEIIFTTNRDEMAARPTDPPKLFEVDGQKLIFPQDKLAGGTWVAVSETGQISCVLNGAEEEGGWLGTTAAKSRGQVLLDSFKYPNFEEFYQDETMKLAHPFTLLIMRQDANEIQMIKWNGKRKWYVTLDASTPHIWSAITLYPESQRVQRETMFKDWTNSQTEFHAKDIWKMHQSTKEENGLLLLENDTVNTVSTTQILLSKNDVKMSYFQMDNQEMLSKSMVVKS